MDGQEDPAREGEICARAAAFTLHDLAVVGLVSLLWALCYPLVTTAVRYAPPLELAALRASLAGLTLVVVAAVGSRPPPPRRLWPAVAAIGLSSTGLGFAGMFLAGGHISPGLATVLANTQPLLAAIGGAFVLPEALGRRDVGALALGFGGILVIAAPSLGVPVSGSGTALRGIAFVMLGAVGVATGNLIMKRIATRVDAVSTTGWQLLAGALALGIASRFAPGGTEIAWTAGLWIPTVVLAVPGTALAFVLWLRLLRRFPLHRLNVFTYSTPAVALAIGALFYGERLGPAEVGGIGLITLGLATASVGSRAAQGRSNPVGDHDEPKDATRAGRPSPAGRFSAGGSEREHRVPLPDGRTLACLEMGDPDGAPLLYFHGFPGSRREGRLAADAGAHLGLRVLALDRPGFGESTFLAARTIGSWPQDVGALADRFSLDRFAVLGVSGGGPYALACAARIPERLSRVALVCPLGPAVRRDLTAGMVALNRRALSLAAHAPSLARLVLGLVTRLARRYPDRFFAHMDASAPPADEPVLADPRYRALLEASTTEALRQGGRGLAHELMLLGRPWDFSLADVPLRVPIWQGLDDNIVPPAMARYLAQTLPRGEVHYVSGEGHVSLIVRHLAAVLAGLRP